VRLDELVVAAEADGAVRRLTLPASEAGWSARLARELADVAGAMVEEREVRAVVLDATPDWCTGADPDLDPYAQHPDPAAALARLRVPVIAVLRGRCRSVGLEVALAADLRVAAPDVACSLDDVRAGRLPCWGGTQRLPRIAGTPTATAMLLLGAELNADEARRRGLVHEVADDPGAVADRWVEQVLAVAPLATELAKEAVHRGAELPLRDGLRLEGDLNHLLQSTTDRAEGLAAFFEKRPADFAGR
jgi:enoyl-CoA hydratase